MDSWAPCAIGMLPSTSNPCGRMPVLDAPPVEAAARAAPDVPQAEAAKDSGGGSAQAEDKAAADIVRNRLGVLNEDAWQRADVMQDQAEPHDYFARFGTGDAAADEQMMFHAPVQLTMAQVRGIAAMVKLM